MNNQWSSLPGAPEPGSVICHLDDIPDAGTLCLRLDDFPILVLRVEGLVRVFVNACPHQYLPLNHRGDKLLSADARIVRCTNHGAGFSVLDGVGVEGLALGTRLDRIPVMLNDVGELVIADSKG